MFCNKFKRIVLNWRCSFVSWCSIYAQCPKEWCKKKRKRKKKTKSSRKTKKSHTCEEGGALLSISFWYLLISFEKTKKSKFWKNEKKLLEISSFYTCVPKTTIIWGTVPEIRSETELFAILGHFLPFYTPSLTTQKTKIFKKWKKHLEMSSF